MAENRTKFAGIGNCNSAFLCDEPVNFRKWAYVFFKSAVSSFERFDLFMTTTIIFLAIIIVISIPVQAAPKIKNRQLSTVCNIISIILMVVVYIGGFQISIKDVFNNSISNFDLEGPKYEAVEEVNVIPQKKALNILKLQMKRLWGMFRLGI